MLRDIQSETSRITVIEIWILLAWPLVAQMVKHLPAMRETQVQSLGQENLLEKETATHSSTLAWKIPWTEEPGRLQSMGSQRVRHDWAASFHFTCLTPGDHDSISSFLYTWPQMKRWLSNRMMLSCVLSIKLNKWFKKRGDCQVGICGGYWEFWSHAWFRSIG